MLEALQTAIANTQAHLDSLRHPDGHWEGHLSSSALSTATAIVALHLVDAARHAAHIESGIHWLETHQNPDGGWGDTPESKSNLSTTLLVWSALHLGARVPSSTTNWLKSQIGDLTPQNIATAVIARYGKDKTFSVPILMHAALCGTLGQNPWKLVLALPFELASLPRTWFGAIGLPVVSYALPALIAIGYLRFQKRPPAWWNPLRWLRALAWSRVRPMLKELQPSSGGYLEATPLTSFVTMALAGAGDRAHPAIPLAIAFLTHSMRADGSWPIDTNLSTWGTTLAVRSSGFSPSQENGLKPELQTWLLAQQYHAVHLFTNAPPGGWAWTPLPGGVPDADDTASALITLKLLHDEPSDTIRHSRFDIRHSATSGITWLLDLQNRDGGIPTFCRGWGTLPFDRSTPEITAHALLAWWTWKDWLSDALKKRITKATERAMRYLRSVQRTEGSWIPLWFGNEHTPDESNPVYGTAQVMNHLLGETRLSQRAERMLRKGEQYLRSVRKPYGPWGGDLNAPATIEETAVALTALCRFQRYVYEEARRNSIHVTDGWTAIQELMRAEEVVEPSFAWLLTATRHGTHFPPAPIGLYFARLWYHEQLYPVIWTHPALRSAH